MASGSAKEAASGPVAAEPGAIIPQSRAVRFRVVRRTYAVVALLANCAGQLGGRNKCRALSTVSQ
jgi:hypothetical protein